MEEMKSPPLTCPNTVTVRRNPHRKARPTPSTAVPQIPTSPSKNLPEISSFPIDEILSIQIPQNPQPDLSQASSTSNNLNVFLRIRPLVLVKSGDQNSKPRAKNVWPKNPAKRVAVKEKSAKEKSSEACITVNDSQSVTLSPPLALQTSKRIRSVVYQGFSYVFSADSSQGKVYERMLNPLVEEFLRGKSGMLAALGPSGSGKTHTIFGSPRDPGMVSLALQQIFKGTTSIGSESRRSFYLSIFEIYSERGKGERMLDLSPDGGDLFMQQSTIKGLQEVIISDAAEAEFLISRAMLRRATAMTNANSQSSRSQCIINIRSTASKPDGKGNVPVKDVVLTIVDLAGAEREKKTGNQGSRLLESNFINNTSMIFGLCLRVCRLNSVIWIPGQPCCAIDNYQFHCISARRIVGASKESKEAIGEAFSKFFVDQVPTGLFGRKEENDTGMRFSFPKLGYSVNVLQLKHCYILTVKPGEEDYLDTSYLLRQASPYMKIKFDNVVDPSNLVSNKRHFQTPRVEQPKRMKFSGLEACSIEEAKSIVEENQLSEDGCLKDIKDHAPVKPNAVDLAKKERNHQITQNFAKAVWNVLKQYNEKLKVAESEMKILIDKLSSENTRNQELERELKELKSCSNCSRESSEAITSSKTNTDFKYGMKLDGQKSSKVHETSLDINSPHLRTSEHGSTSLKYESTPGQDEDTLPQITLECDSPKLKSSERNSTPNNYGFTPRQDQVVLSQENLDVYSLHLWASETNSTPLNCDTTPEHEKDKLSQINVDIDSPNTKRSELNGTTENYDISSSQDQDVFSQINVDVPSSNLKTSECHTISEQCNSPTRVMEPLDSSPSPKKVASIVCNNVLYSETSPNTSHKPVTIEKPKRRLMPASSILLRDISALDVEDEFEKPKGNRNGKKVAANEGKITQGNLSLLRLLKTHLRL
ncbi:hypothetical protein EZV62_021205 [Acer yangbiense]|uniref:Kinesin motor domain-containing protein n=1 Tax=Acer yangbiense TaxID=1000413 RepID=A0A5C7H749_9ROSI|nr:hypothetical protein EZV62_021205 [Acer yangbiense]